MDEKNKKFYSKLGLGGALTTNQLNNFIDTNKAPDSRKKTSVYLDIENLGTLKRDDYNLILRKNLSQQFYHNFSYKTIESVQVQTASPKYYFSTYNTRTPVMDMLGFIHFGEMLYSPESNNFFRRFANRLTRFRLVDKKVIKYRNMSFARRPAKNEKILSNISAAVDVNKYIPSGFANNDLPFSRINFPSGNTSNLHLELLDTSPSYLSNSSSTGYMIVDLNPENLNGIQTYFNTGSSGANISSINNRFSKSLKSRDYLYNYQPIFDLYNSNPEYFVNNNITNISGHHLSYPNTLDIQQFKRLNLPTKIAVIDNYDESLNINGILMIATGDPSNGVQKICYISPHKIEPIYANTIQNYISKSLISIKDSGINSTRAQYKNTEEIFQIKTFNFTSKYNTVDLQMVTESGERLYGLGLNKEFYTYDSEYIPSKDNSLKLLKSQINSTNINTSGMYQTGTFLSMRYICHSGEHLQQKTPIQDTPYYKIFNNIYTGVKTFNTGTWDGIIPPNTTISIELVSTSFSQIENLGCNRNFAIIYSGQGTLDPTDAKLLSGLSLTNYKHYLRNAKIVEDYVSFEGRKSSFSIESSVLASKSVSRKKINQYIDRMVKYFFPEILFENRPWRKMQKYLNNIYKKQLSNNATLFINNDYILERGE
jgi:hypothetical protein